VGDWVSHGQYQVGWSTRGEDYLRKCEWQQSDAIMLCGGRVVRQETQLGEGVVVVGSIPCRVSSEMHADGRRVVGSNTREAVNKVIVAACGSRLKRARLMSVEGCEIIRSIYPELACSAGRRVV
jgi:hypothetical protein